MIDLPDFTPLKIIQSPDQAGSEQLNALDHLIAVVPKTRKPSVFRRLPKSALLERVLGQAERSGGSFASTFLDNRHATAVTVAACGSSDCFARLSWARKVVAECARMNSSKIGLVIVGFDPGERDAILSAVVRAVEASAFALPTYRSKRNEPPIRPSKLKIFKVDKRQPVSQLNGGAMGNNVARWLTALPPNKLTAASYRTIARELASRYSLKYEFYDVDKLERLGAGAFLAVAQGNALNDAGIIHLRYTPGRTQSPALSLVGKGIIFDTGGTNLKPFKSMLDMHMDMQGSAVALGTALELASRKVPFAFDVWLAVTENRLSAKAYKSQDVVVAANGTSIQVIHTDAEGRMVLADTLALAAKRKPKLIIDYATLTGTCIVALTTRYSGVFSNRAGAVRCLLAAGMSSGERIWPFPMGEDYDDALKSDVADLKQCVVDGNGDHIYAACFLKHFVPDAIPWVHVDLSAGQHKGGLGAIPTEITGFGVAFTLELLADSDPGKIAAQWTTD